MDNSSADALADALTRSRSPEYSDRCQAAAALGRFISDEAAVQRLVEMLDDDEDIAVQVDAAEILVRHGGRRGMAVVLEELGRRADDPDVDYIAYKLEELEGSGEAPVLSVARSIRAEGATPNAEIGIDNIEHLFGYRLG